jgi:hypothetical protein
LRVPGNEVEHDDRTRTAAKGVRRSIGYPVEQAHRVCAVRGEALFVVGRRIERAAGEAAPFVTDHCVPIGEQVGHALVCAGVPVAARDQQEHRPGAPYLVVQAGPRDGQGVLCRYLHDFLLRHGA